MTLTPPPDNNAALAAKLEAVLAKANALKDDPKRFTVYADTPLQFAFDIFGIPVWSPERPDTPGLTPHQVELLQAAVTDRRIAARSGHGNGKSFVLAFIAVWWLYCREGRVVTTASTWSQVEKVLWGEIATLLGKARVKLPGELLQTELRIAKDWYAVGISTDDSTAIQGRHHPRLLVIVDEAPGVEEKIHDAIASLCTGERNTIIMVGNPTESTGTFYNAFRRGSWTRLHFSCLDHPNVLLGREVIPGAVTRQWVEEAKEKWGAGTPMYDSRVLGNFPSGSSTTVIPVAWCEQSMSPEKYRVAVETPIADEPIVLAVDVARYGDNRCVMAQRRGHVVTDIIDWGQVSTMETVGIIMQRWRETDARLIVVDEVGLGAGVLDRLLELNAPVVGFHSGRAASDKTLFLNRRSELWWKIRKAMEADELRLPDHDPLRDDLTAPLYKINSAGKISVERKEDMRARGVKSPDFADAVCMTFSIEADEELDLPPASGFVAGEDSVRFDAESDRSGPLAQLASGF